MTLFRHQFDASLRATANTLAAAAILCALLIITVRAMVHFPFFDEITHFHNLWLISGDLRPGTDFFSYYPVAGYLFILPFFKLFPESAYVLIALRYLMMVMTLGVPAILVSVAYKIRGDWLLAVIPVVLLAASRNIGPFWAEFSIDHLAACLAVAAMSLLVRKNSLVSLTAAAALSGISLLVMPKYAFPLTLGLIGSCLAAGRKPETLPRLGSCLLGGAVAVAVVAMISNAAGISLFATMKTVMSVQTARQFTNNRHELPRYVLMNLVFKPFFGTALLLGVIGWWRRTCPAKDAGFWGGAGILAGTVLLCAVWGNPLEQYQAPVYISLAIFSPFAAHACRNGTILQAIRCTFAVASLVICLQMLPSLAREFSQTALLRHTESVERVPPAFVVLRHADELLKLIPRHERVIALWAGHPVYRADITGLTNDEQPTFSQFLPPDSPAAQFFSPATLRASLAERPPALIDLAWLERNYPPGWSDIIKEYVTVNKSLYQEFPSPIFPSFPRYIRKDLLTAEPALLR